MKQNEFLIRGTRDVLEKEALRQILKNFDKELIDVSETGSMPGQRRMFPEAGLTELLITTGGGLSLSILANFLYEKLFKNKGEIQDKNNTEIIISLPDGTRFEIRQIDSKTHP